VIAAPRRSFSVPLPGRAPLVLGPLTFGKKEEQIFLGREIAQHTDYSEDTALKIDGEVKRIVNDQYARCTALLTENKQKLTDIADALLAREVLDADQVRRIVNGHPLDDAPAAEIPAPDAAPAREKDRPSLVPPMEPIRKPLAQE